MAGSNLCQKHHTHLVYDRGKVRLHKSGVYAVFFGGGGVNLFSFISLIKMRCGCLGPCRVIEMTAFFFLSFFVCVCVLPWTLGADITCALVCILPLTLGHMLPRPSPLTHHIDHHSPSFAVHPFK